MLWRNDILQYKMDYIYTKDNEDIVLHLLCVCVCARKVLSSSAKSV